MGSGAQCLSLQSPHRKYCSKRLSASFGQPSFHLREQSTPRIHTASTIAFGTIEDAESTIEPKRSCGGRAVKSNSLARLVFAWLRVYRQASEFYYHSWYLWCKACPILIFDSNGALEWLGVFPPPSGILAMGMCCRLPRRSGSHLPNAACLFHRQGADRIERGFGMDAEPGTGLESSKNMRRIIDMVLFSQHSPRDAASPILLQHQAGHHYRRPIGNK